MTIEEVAFNLAKSAVLEASDASPEHPNGQARPNAHLDYERKLLDMALNAAEERPDLEHEIWSTVSSSVCELNDHLYALEVPPVKFVNYAIFNAWVAWRLDRSEAVDDLDDSADTQPHTIH